MNKAVHTDGGCFGGFYARKAFDGRPEFVCTKCGMVWTAGWSGEPFLTQARNSGTDNGVMPRLK